MSQLFFKKPYQDAIRAGRKTTTIRRWDRARVQAGKRAFSPGLGWLAIDAIDAVDLDALDDRDAEADGFETAAQMRRLLRKLYPESGRDGKRWFRVRFRVEELYSRRKTAHASEPGLFQV